VIGKKQVANFAVESWPQGGTYWMTAFLAGVVAISAWHLVVGRRAAVKAARLETGYDPGVACRTA
jgi:hypothetical protein